MPVASANQLLIAYIRCSSTADVDSISGGWTRLDFFNEDATDDRDEVWYKWADGTEGATASVSWGAAVKGACIVWRITGAINPATQPPEVTNPPNTGTGANGDPPSLSPTGGSKDYLFLALMGLDSETATFTAPSGYSNIATANSGTAGQVATNCRIAGATRQVTTATENPGTFTSTAPQTGWMAHTVAVHPTTASPDALIRVYPRGQAVKRASAW